MEAKYERNSSLEDKRDARQSSLEHYFAIRRSLYETAETQRSRREVFEALVKRPYFHVKPLDGMQLANWNDYLSYEEEHGDENSIVRLYERCLIPCAYYPNFWMRYARCMERLQGPQVARDIIHRATRIHLKRNHELFLALARFEEHNGNLGAAREA